MQRIFLPGQLERLLSAAHLPELDGKVSAGIRLDAVQRHELYAVEHADGRLGDHELALYHRILCRSALLCARDRVHGSREIGLAGSGWDTGHLYGGRTHLSVRVCPQRRDRPQAVSPDPSGIRLRAFPPHARPRQGVPSRPPDQVEPHARAGRVEGGGPSDYGRSVRSRVPGTHPGAIPAAHFEPYARGRLPAPGPVRGIQEEGP